MAVKVRGTINTLIIDSPLLIAGVDEIISVDGLFIDDETEEIEPETSSNFSN